MRACVAAHDVHEQLVVPQLLPIAAGHEQADRGGGDLGAGGDRGAAEALRLWTIAPASVKEAAAAVDFAQRQWPPAAEKAAKAFLAVVTADGLPPAP